MANHKIVDLKAQAAEKETKPTPAPPPKRSAAAHAALAKMEGEDELGEHVDQDAFMATFDAAAELAKAGEIHLGAGPVGITAMYEMPGRPDLALAHGRGTGGCSFVMAVPRPPEAPKVEEKTWTEETEAELETVKTDKR